ncbi:MAG: RagB/SusD family nutrient uptake outer membrane protein [Bacteroidaceae bacterium]|nr:RagB/SusD family nutrient uptake outer membrane protein [Bacteroidaceae bacterium]
MRTTIKSLLPVAVLALSFGLTSCVDDLNVTPKDPSTNMTVTPENLFNKTYALMAVAGNGGANGDSDVDGLDGGTTGFVRQLFNAQSLTTDEAHCVWGDQGISDFNHNSFTASHPMLKGFYYRLYFGVTMCNHYLEVAADHDKTMTAEVRFLRALYYYYLMDGWGNVTLRTTISMEKAKQVSRAELYAWIEQEVLAAEADMAEAKPEKEGEAGYGRADKAAAWMLLSRLYLNAEVYTGKAEWAKAKEYAAKVMNSPFKLHTAPTQNGWTAYQQLFMGDNGTNGASQEGILCLIQDGEKTTSWGTTLFLMAATSKDDMKDNQFYSGNGTVQNWAGITALPTLVQKFFPNDNAPEASPATMQAAAGDDRALFWSKGRTLSIDDESAFTNGYSVMKFNNYYLAGGQGKHSTYCDTDFFLMRAAEAYLNFAEADARLNGGKTTQAGTDAVNAIRNRAHANPQPSFDLNQILNEYAREFYFEGRRRTDLIRHNKYGGNTGFQWQWKGGAKTGVNFSANYNLFPIPDTDMNAHGELTQNPGY